MFELFEHGVEHGGVDELAGETHVVQCRGSVLGDERAGRTPILAQHDIGLVAGPVLGVGMQLSAALDFVERCLDIADVELGQRELLDLGSDVLLDPFGRLHDMRIGVVNDTVGDVRHGSTMPRPHRRP